jgi:phage/plasmid-associated DNA primase
VNYDIVGKLANIGDDTPQTAIADTANIKMIISGGNIKVEGKFKKAHNYIPFCKLVFACNSRIQSSDPSKGYKRRFFNVPFKVQFQTDPTIEQAFQSEFDKEEEKSGLFNEITKRFKATYKTGYIIPHAVAHDVEMYEPYPEGLEEWLANNLVKSPGHQIPAADLTSAINFVLDRRGNKGPKKCYTMKRVCRWVLNKFGISEDAGGDVVKDSTIQQHRPTTEGVKKTYLTGLSVVDPSIFDTSSGPDDVKFSEDVNDDAEGLDYDD